MAKVFITGASGFIGTLLTKVLPNFGFEIHPYSGDIFNSKELADSFKQNKFDHVIHLAGKSHVPSCDNNPSEAYQVNTAGTALIAELLYKHSPNSRILFASSAQVYASTNDGQAIDEHSKITPQNLYGVTKWNAELILKDHAQRNNLKTTIVRIFNHTHKSHSPTFFLPHLYNELLKHTKSKKAEIPVGNLEIYRDIGAVQDLLSAFLALLNSKNLETFETFNVCSGTTKSVKELAQLLAERMEVSAEYIVDPVRVRPNEAKSICGSSKKLQDKTQWKPIALNAKALIDHFFKDI